MFATTVNVEEFPFKSCTASVAKDSRVDYVHTAPATNRALTIGEFHNESHHRNSCVLGTEWMPAPGGAVNPAPSAYYCVITASVSAVVESVFQKFQALDDVRFSTAIEKSASLVAATLAGVYALDKQGYNRSAAREIMIYVESNLRRNALSETNQLLCEADVSNLSSRSMIGLIRATHRLKKELPAWDKVYRDSWHQVRKLGKTPETLFVGLPSVTED